MESLCLVTDFDGKTIKLESTLIPANKSIKPLLVKQTLIIDSGADTSALTREFLKKNGYGKYSKTGKVINTATGDAELLSCEINGLTIANQFKFGKMKVDILENWKSHQVVGVIGLDILSQMTFILSHEHKKYLLTDQKIPELAKLFV